MEVDLTDDDFIMTTPLPLPKTPVRHESEEKRTKSALSLVETVDITDDDDIIFVEASPPPPKEQTKNPKQDVVLPANAATTSQVPENKRPGSSLPGDIMEVDEVSKAVASISSTVQGNETPTQQSSTVAEKKDDKGPEKTSNSIAWVPAKSSSVVDNSNVIDITDDDDSINERRRKAENTCLNVCCKSGEDLAKAPMFVVSYFGCKLKKGKHEVCAECFNTAVNHHKVCMFTVSIIFTV